MLHADPLDPRIHVGSAGIWPVLDPFWTRGSKYPRIHYADPKIRGSKRSAVPTRVRKKIRGSKMGQKSIENRFAGIRDRSNTDMCESFNIEIMKTAAESPWSNGTCERHNSAIKMSVLKTMEDTKCSIDTAVAWAISVKNSLHGHHGYSPNTLVFGRN